MAGWAIHLIFEGSTPSVSTMLVLSADMVEPPVFYFIRAAESKARLPHADRFSPAACAARATVHHGRATDHGLIPWTSPYRLPSAPPGLPAPLRGHHALRPLGLPPLRSGVGSRGPYPPHLLKDSPTTRTTPCQVPKS